MRTLKVWVSLPALSNLIGFFDDIVAQPTQLFAEVFAFLGVEASPAVSAAPLKGKCFPGRHDAFRSSAVPRTQVFYLTWKNTALASADTPNARAEATGRRWFNRMVTRECKCYFRQADQVPVSSSRATETIQPTPKRSISIPNFGDQNVFASGIVTCPPSHSALNRQSASFSFGAEIESEKPSNFAFTIRSHQRCLTDTKARMHHLFLHPRLYHARLWTVLESRKHQDFGTHCRAVKLQRFAAAATEKQRVEPRFLMMRS